jgi:hypothetical protein
MEWNMEQRLLKNGRAFGLTAALALAPFTSAWSAPFNCGDLANPYGPFDYRTIPTINRTTVEDHHFTPKVESLQGGQSGYLGGDIDYTLRAMPNNPRALMAMMKLGEREKTEKDSVAHYSVECYFDRAIRFTPDDPMPRLIYSIYLKSHKRFDDMRVQLAEAERLQGDTPTNFDIDYNAGLLYFESKDYDKSYAAAKRAYAMGAPLPGLQNKLKSVGKWPKE